MATVFIIGPHWKQHTSPLLTEDAAALSHSAVLPREQKHASWVPVPGVRGGERSLTHRQKCTFYDSIPRSCKMGVLSGRELE